MENKYCYIEVKKEKWNEPDVIIADGKCLKRVPISTLTEQIASDAWDAALHWKKDFLGGHNYPAKEQYIKSITPK